MSEHRHDGKMLEPFDNIRFNTPLTPPEME